MPVSMISFHKNFQVMAGKPAQTAAHIPLLFTGTAFQEKVWRQLLEIPYGQAISYGEMAKRLGIPRSVRAVANANGANALCIFAPCHRVVGSNGSLAGFGGGLEAKRFLLALERESFC